MKTTTRKATATMLATGLFAFSSAAMATNGYFTHGVGTESKGMGGTGVGSSSNMGAISAATNPALAVFADEKWQVGLSAFSPMRSHTTSQSFANGQGGAFTLSQGSHDSKNELFPNPYVGKNWKLSDDKAITMVFYGRGGMNTEWDSGQTVMTDPTGQGGKPATLPGLYGGGAFGPGFGVAGVDLMQAFLSVNYASKVNDNFAWGIGPVVAVQSFEATGLGMFSGYSETFAQAFLGNGMGAPVPHLTNNGHEMSVGYGASAGIWAGNDKLSFGLAYQTKMSMGEFDDYADLYAQRGGFDIPSTLKAGISYRASDAVTVNLDIEHIGYSDIDSIANPIMNLLTGCFTANPMVAPATHGCLGGPSGAGFGWDDMTIYKTGFEWATNDTNTWRAGYSYGKQPIPNTEVLFNILAPGVIEHHFTVGWTGERAGGNVMSMSLMYAPSKTVTGTNTFDPTQTIEIEMSQLEFEFAYRF